MNTFWGPSLNYGISKAVSKELCYKRIPLYYCFYFLQGNQIRRHSVDHKNKTENSSSRPVPVYLHYSDIKKKTKLVKILPALSTLKDNVKYVITNRKDKYFFIREKRGISSLHVKPKKIHPFMSYQVNIEGDPIQTEEMVQGRHVHLNKSVFEFQIYVL